MSEYSPGQFEITLHHRDDALRAVDEAVMFKRVLRGVAQKHGLIACFMAKPFTARAGSGLHVHVSLNDAQGKNLFASDDPAGTPALRQAIGGMKDSMAESMAVFAPNANSYRRFVSESYAPVAPIWGINNRSVSVCACRRARRCRATSSIASAAPMPICTWRWPRCWALPRMALRERLDPGAPVEGNGYAQAGVRTLPGKLARGARSSPRSPSSSKKRSARNS